MVYSQNSMPNIQQNSFSLEIFLLGEFKVKVGGVPVEEHLWLRRSAKLIVKLLALKPRRGLHREQVIDLLWTEQDFETASNNLNKAIYMARRAMEPNLSKGSHSQFILTNKQQIILHSPVSLFIDVEEFERLAAVALKVNNIEAGKKALNLYRDDLLTEDIYEDWLSARRESLRLLYRKVATKTAELYAERNEYEPGVELLNKLLADDATDEHTHRQLMSIYAQTGSRYQALKQFEQCRSALLSLGLEPETETVKLEEIIKNGKIVPIKAGFELGSARQQQQSSPAQISSPRMRQITFQRGGIQSARFSPDDQIIIYSAAWEGGSLEIYATHRETGESRSVGVQGASIFSVSLTGEVAAALNRKFLRGYTSVGTLARMHLSGGVPRALFENVQWADWFPDKECLADFSANQCLAVVRDSKGKNCLEYPVGQTLFETGGWISHPRFSPAGDKIAFIEHPTLADDSGVVAVVHLVGENSKEKQVLTRDWVSVQGLAWAAEDEIWFTAAREGNARAIRAVDLKGKERLIYRGMGSMTLHDITKNSEALVTVDKTRIQIAGRFSDKAAEQNLSWHDWSLARDLSDDSKILLFTEAGESGGSLYATYIRKTDGSSALRISNGSALALSPDGKFALVRLTAAPQQLALVAIGAGEIKLLAPAKSESFFYQPWACFFPDGKRILFAVNEKNKGTQLYVQDINGEPECITPEEEGVEISSPRSISPDGEQVAIINAENSLCLFEIKNRKYSMLKNLEDYLPVRWSGDGKYLFVRKRGQVPAVIYRYELATEQKEDWLELMPKDATGVDEILRVLLTADGKSYAYSFTRELSDLYVIEGLQ